MIQPTFSFSIERRGDNITISVASPVPPGARVSTGSWEGPAAYLEFLMWLLKSASVYAGAAMPPLASSIDATLRRAYDKLSEDLLERGVAAYTVLSAALRDEDFDA